MATIPYGYKIIRGKAVVDPEAVNRIEAFFDHYLGGLSIKEANKIAGIPLCQTSVIKLMKNELYLGTDYYPPLITAEVFYAVQKEREKRTHEGTSVPVQPIPVKSEFILVLSPEKVEHKTAAETVALIYSMITPSEHGHAMATGSEIAALKAWARKRPKENSTIPHENDCDEERSSKCQ